MTAGALIEQAGERHVTAVVRPQRMSIGARILRGYVVVAYLIPAIVLAATPHDSERYRFPRFGTQQIVYALLLFFALWVVVASRGNGTPRPRITLQPPPFLVQAGLIASLILVSAVGFVGGLGRWRYGDTSLSENLGIISIVFIIAPPIYYLMMFLEIFCFSNAVGAAKLQRRIIAALLAVGMALVATGLGSMFTVLLAVVYFLFPAQFRLLVFRERVGDGDRNTARLGLVPMIGFGATMFLVAVVLGEQIKTGADSTTAADHFLLADPWEFFTYLVDRFSTAWISLQVALAEYTTFHWSDTEQLLTAPIYNFLFRLDVMLGGTMNIARPYVGSLMRANYELISLNPINEREGTSPGLIASFVLAFPVQFAIPCLAIYAAFLRRLMNAVSSGMAGSLTPVGMLIALYSFWPLFSSPVDYLLVFDDGPIPLLLFVLLALWIRRKRRQASLAQ